MAGFHGANITRPHLLTEENLRIRDGVLTEIVLPYSAIIAARPKTRASFGRSGLKIDKTTGAALLAQGDANVILPEAGFRRRTWVRRRRTPPQLRDLGPTR